VRHQDFGLLSCNEIITDTVTSNTMKNTLLTIIALFFIQTHVYSQETRIDSLIYKRKDSVSLLIKVFNPPSIDSSKNYPAMVFFSGGNWNYGNMTQFELQAKYFSSRGIICFLAEYGVKGTHKMNVWECITDVKSSIRYIRENANKFNIDENKIIAAGGSAGGHLAAATAIISCCDDPNDHLSISSKPNALVLFNPAIDFGPSDPELFEMAGERYIEISPLQNIRSGVPPTIVLQGTADKYTPVSLIRYYKHVMEAVGSRCDLILYEGQEHGFFNYSRSIKYYKETVLEVDKFLHSLGYIDGEPTIMNEK
jgi:acetyl esterase